MSKEDQTLICNLRGEILSVPTASIKKILPTLREGVNVVHFHDGGWKFIVDDQFIEFTDEEEGEESEQN